MKDRKNLFPLAGRAHQRPIGCAIDLGMSLMGAIVEGPLPQEPEDPVFRVIQPCKVEGCEVVIEMKTIGDGIERKLFYRSRGADAVHGICQLDPVPEPS